MSTTIRRGFTLIELLVVVAIIAILIAILLPSLARSKTQAKKTQCLANLRSTSMGIRMYASDFDDVVALGAWAVKQHNYLVFQKSRPSAFGVIIAAGYIGDGKPYYCPSYEFTPGQASLQYNDIANGNPWRSYPLPTPDPFATMNTRLGYGMRPLANWQPSGTGCVPIKDWYLVDTGQDTDSSIGSAGSRPQMWPKLATLNLSAILSDVTPHYPALAGRHKDGVNALYGSGAAYWVPAPQFINSIMGPGKPSADEKDPNVNFFLPSTRANNNAMLNEDVNPPTGFWADLDRNK